MEEKDYTEDDEGSELETEKFIEEELPKPIKKRGRPKKIRDAHEGMVSSTELPEIKPEKQIDEKAIIFEAPTIQERDTPIPQVIPTAPLADKDPYPNLEEQEVQEDPIPTRPIINDNGEGNRFWSKIFNKNKIKKSGMVAVLLLHATRDAESTYVEVDQHGMFKVQNQDYHVNQHCLYFLRIKKDYIPLCILPTWSMIPIGTKAWFELSQERKGHELEGMIIAAIRKEEVLKEEEPKKKALSGKMIWIIIALIIGGYFFFTKFT